MKQFLKILALVNIVNLCAMEEGVKTQVAKSGKWQHDTYKGEPITSENIYKLSPKPNPNLQKELDAFWSHPDNKSIIRTLNSFNLCKDRDELLALVEAHKKFMQEHNIKNLSDFNYVFKVKDKNGQFHNFVIKIAGPLNILRSRASTVSDSDPYSKRLSEFGVEKITDEAIETYQHVSSMAHYLRLFEIARSFKHLKVAPTYIYPINDTVDKSCHDRNCITIQELIPDEDGVVELHKLKPEEITEILENLPEQAIKELYLAIKHAALWNFWSNLLVNIKDKRTFWLTDLEQPNNANAKGFFFKKVSPAKDADPKTIKWLQDTTGYQQYEGNANCGLNEMTTQLEKHAPKQHKLWQELIKKNWQEFFDEMTNQ
mgnify:CR=1 FL=1